MEPTLATMPPVSPVEAPDGSLSYGAFFTEDPRDHNLAAYVPIVAATQPEAYYPNITGIPYWYQRQLGACVGHAAAKAKQVCDFHESGARVITPYSARFLYAMAKCLDGIPDIQGTDPRLVAKIMQKYGCATEATCPNDTTLSHEEYTYGGKLANIPAAALAEALNHRISNYAFADINEASIKAAIQFAGENKGGVFMLTEIDKNWWTAPSGVSSWAKKDLLVPRGLRTPTDYATLGGHETMPYAFDGASGRTVIKDFNSWSPGWCSQNGWTTSTDGGSADMDLQDWLPHIRQVIVFFDVPTSYQALGFTYKFTQALKQGMTNSDVVALQHCLRIDGEFPEGVAFTGYFGPTTLAAVKAFQAKYAADILYPQGLTQPTGLVSTGTIAKLNSLFAPK